MPPAAKPEVIVVDDDDSFRELVARTLETGGYVVRSFATGEEALKVMQVERPQLVLLDVCLVGMSGYDVCRVLRRRFGDALPIIFVSGERVEPFDRVAGLRLGADDYVVKPMDPNELLARVDRLIARTGSAMSSPAQPSFKLTKRETDVLELLIAGLRTKEIAQELSISKKTVATHVQNILAKFGVHSQAQAVAAALSRNFNGNGARPLTPLPPSGVR